MGKTGHGGFVLCSHHMPRPTDVAKEKGRYSPITRLRHRKTTLEEFRPANWRESTVKVSPCDHCASNEAALRAKAWRGKARSFSPGELIEACKKFIGSYEKQAAPGETPDAYADCLLPLYNVVHPYDIILVKQVLFGYCRYYRLINSFIRHFYAVKATMLSHEDQLLYKVLVYLAVFRLDELNWSEFRRLCSSQVPMKVLPFMQATFLEELTLRYAKEDWLKIYDGMFVNDLLRGLGLFYQEAQTYTETLAETVYRPDPGLRYIPPPTTVIPFNLSISNYAHVIEEPKSYMYKAKLAPFWDKGRTLEMRRVSQVFKLNRLLIKEKYSDPRYQPFRIRSLERPTNLESIREEVEARRAQECEYIVAKSAPVPRIPEIEVKLTTAALLREHSRFEKIIDSDKQKLKNLERELRDDAHMRTYEDELRTQEEIEHCIDVEFKKATVIASDQAARDAKKKHLWMNWAVASVTKESKEKTHHEYSLLLKNILFAQRFKHHLVKEDEKELMKVKNKAFNEKRRLVKELNAESEDRLAVAALQRGREYQCKQELVRQLHFLEKESCYKIPKFDIYSTGGHGTLSEMSIAELRERLVQVKKWHQEEKERKKNIVHEKTMGKRQMLRETARMVTRMRQVTRAKYLSEKARKQRKDLDPIDAAMQIGM